MYRVSVIIPAHDEASVIDACLESLHQQEGTMAIDVVVAANGCTDDTVVRAQAWQERFTGCRQLRVVEVSDANKIKALNEGDRLARFEVRVYLDADITLSGGAMLELARLLDTDTAVVCAPALEIVTARSWVTRSYAKIWTMLPYFNAGVIGCGCYAVNGPGRRRWGSFPPIVADDKFVRLQFTEHERLIGRDGRFFVRLPEGFKEMVSVRSRWSAGNTELQYEYPHLHTGERRQYLASALLLLKQPRIWLQGGLFVMIFVLAEAKARSRWRRSAQIWERAESVRSGLPG